MNRQRGSRPFWGRFFKRAIDLVGASILSAVLLPVMAGVAALVWLFLGRPVFFLQKRSGLGGRIFTIWKFRTMTSATGSDGRPLADAARLTPFGRLLRQTSLDELPQLLQVLRGEMSLVGPRPLLPEYLDRYTPEQARRHEVKPGITGWCQVRGRNALSWEEKFRLDTWYVDHWSVPLDLSILLQTVLVVLRREGVSHGSDAMPRFLGTNSHPDFERLPHGTAPILGPVSSAAVAWLVDESIAGPRAKMESARLPGRQSKCNSPASFPTILRCSAGQKTYGTLGWPFAAVANSGTREELVDASMPSAARWATLIRRPGSGWERRSARGQYPLPPGDGYGRRYDRPARAGECELRRPRPRCSSATSARLPGLSTLRAWSSSEAFTWRPMHQFAQDSRRRVGPDRQRCCRRRVRPGMTVVGVPGKEFFFPGANVARRHSGMHHGRQTGDRRRGGPCRQLRRPGPSSMKR